MRVPASKPPGKRSVALVAKSVDAPEIFTEAVREGFTYFQGRLIEQRRAGRGRPLEPGSLASLQILQALSDPNLSLGQVEQLVKRDAERVLSRASTGQFGRRRADA